MVHSFLVPTCCIGGHTVRSSYARDSVLATVEVRQKIQMVRFLTPFPSSEPF